LMDIARVGMPAPWRARFGNTRAERRAAVDRRADDVRPLAQRVRLVRLDDRQAPGDGVVHGGDEDDALHDLRERRGRLRPPPRSPARGAAAEEAADTPAAEGVTHALQSTVGEG